MDTQPGIRDRDTTLPFTPLSGDIDFEDVSFHYKENEPVIKHLSFHVNNGETVALVGPTGGGKTTIVNLLCRFYEPTEGTIRIGGIDYLNFSQQNIQSRIGVVLQTPHLFSGTIRENIRYGRLDALMKRWRRQPN